MPGLGGEAKMSRKSLMQAMQCLATAASGTSNAVGRRGERFCETEQRMTGQHSDGFFREESGSSEGGHQAAPTETKKPSERQ